MRTESILVDFFYLIMAENKKSFVLYADLIKSIEHLTYEEKGILFTHLLEYVNDMNPVLTDRLILTAWKPIELQLKRDLKKFEEVKAKRSVAGKRSAELRALKNDEQNATNSTSVESVEQTPTNPTDNDNDNDNDNVINNNNNINFDKLLSFLNSKTGRNFKIINETTKKKYYARLKEGYTKEDILNAISNAIQSDYHKENGFKYLTPEFFSRADKLNMYSSINNKPNENNVNKSLIPKGVSFSGPQY